MDLFGRTRIAELNAGKDEVLRLIESIWRAEYMRDAPNWKPLDDLPGMVSQLDNMYAGVRGQRDEARHNLYALRTEVDSLRTASYGADRTAAMYKRLYEAACKTLGKIAEQETPTANATVKRMARMARSELPVTHHDADHAPSIGMAPQVATHATEQARA